MTREEIEKLNDIRPYCFETDIIRETRKMGFPVSWEDLYEIEQEPIKDVSTTLTCCINDDKTHVVKTILSKKEAESHLAFLKLRVLRDIYRKGWKPDWNDKSVKHVIKVSADSPIIYGDFCVRSFLSFSDTMTAYLFYENFKDLIWQAKDLI